MALTNTQQTDSNCLYIIENSSVEEVSNKISGYFVSQNYKLEKGTPENAVYGIGNDVMRIILGAFVKRYKFQVTVNMVDNNVNVNLTKAMTGVSGGAIGYAKLKKEFARITEELKTVLM